MRRALVVGFGVAQCIACGDNLPPAETGRSDASVDEPTQDMLVDTRLDEMDARQLVRVHGNVDFGGPLEGTRMTLVSHPDVFTFTDNAGDFYFDFGQGLPLVIRAQRENRPEILPMIRGVVAQDDLRPRVFYLFGPAEVNAASSLGKTFDSSKAVLAVDFRNASIGGYGATLTMSGSATTPEFGVAFEDDGDPAVSITTITGGSGSTLILAGLPVGAVSVTPVVPGTATLPCQQRDADPLPLEAGTVTWIDFECGNGTD